MGSLRKSKHQLVLYHSFLGKQWVCVCSVPHVCQVALFCEYAYMLAVDNVYHKLQQPYGDAGPSQSNHCGTASQSFASL